MIFIGYILRSINLLTLKRAQSLFKIVFYITLPATVFLAISHMQLYIKLGILPLSFLLIMGGFFLFGRWLVNHLNLNEKDRKIALAGTILANSAYLGYPLLNALYGAEGLSSAVLFDSGGTIISYGVVYWIVSSNKQNTIKNIKKIIFNPVIWSLLIGLFVNLYAFQVPSEVLTGLGYISLLTTPLIMLALGAFLRPKIKYKAVALYISIGKIVVGLFISSLIVILFGLEGVVRNVVLIGSILPSAILTIMYASIEKLNRELAVDIVTVSTVLSLIVITLLTLFL